LQYLIVIGLLIWIAIAVDWSVFLLLLVSVVVIGLIVEAIKSEACIKKNINNDPLQEVDITHRFFMDSHKITLDNHGREVDESHPEKPSQAAHIIIDSQNRENPQKRAVTDGPVTKGLIIMEEPLNKILAGLKTWEMRSTPTKIRGTIALIKKGSKAIYGVADIVDSLGPLSDDEMVSNIDKTRISQARLNDQAVKKWRHAWVLQNVRRLEKPIPYTHRSGQVIFVNLDPQAQARLNQVLNS
jgi:hypothetical protein